MLWLWPRNINSMCIIAWTCWIMQLSLKIYISRLEMAYSTIISTTGWCRQGKSNPMNWVLCCFDSINQRSIILKTYHLVIAVAICLCAFLVKCCCPLLSPRRCKAEGKLANFGKVWLLLGLLGCLRCLWPCIQSDLSRCFVTVFFKEFNNEVGVSAHGLKRSSFHEEYNFILFDPFVNDKLCVFLGNLSWLWTSLIFFIAKPAKHWSR